jgi:hypothetical protein
MHVSKSAEYNESSYIICFPNRGLRKVLLVGKVRAKAVLVHMCT